MRKKVLNTYAGIGGNRKKWTDVDVTAVEYQQSIADVYKKFFQEDNVVVGDAHQYLLDHYNEFDFVWGSPPCPTHSRMAKATRHPKKNYQEIIFLKHFFKGKWVIENVIPYYEPLIPPTKIIGRHCFWSNFEITDFEIDNHKNFIKADTPDEIASMKEWLGLNYEGNLYSGKNHSPGQVLRNCVHPDIGKHIFDCAFNQSQSQGPKIIQQDLFNTIEI